MKVLILGDSPFLKTGFGRVNSHAAAGFLRAGFEVATVTGLQSKASGIKTDLPITIFPTEAENSMGLIEAQAAIAEWEPDCIYATGDPASVGTIASVIPDGMPYVPYIPIEGEPIVHTGWRNVLAYLDFLTCSQYGVDTVRKSLGKTVPYIYHGVDRDVFSPLTEQDREHYRKILGWDNKFVVTCVAQNVRRKQLPRLIEAITLLKHQYKQKDIILYLHTVPYQNHWLEGWNLTEIAAAFDVYDEVIFNPNMLDRHSAVPEVGTQDDPGLRELLGASDLFVLPSQVEGFGLPIAEAMAMGLPTMVTKYGAGWEVARHGQGVGVPPHDWEIHKSGTRYANVSPETLAKEILHLKRNPGQRARMSAAGLEAVTLFDWRTFESAIAERVVHATEAKAKSTTTQRPADPAEDASSQDGVLEDQMGLVGSSAHAEVVEHRPQSSGAASEGATAP